MVYVEKGLGSDVGDGVVGGEDKIDVWGERKRLYVFC